MAKKLHFSWVVCERVDSERDINAAAKEKQINQLDSMVKVLKEKISTNLDGVTLVSTEQRDHSGTYRSLSDGSIHEYCVNNAVNIILSKQGRKSTWNDVYRVINSIKPSKYELR